MNSGRTRVLLEELARQDVDDLGVGDAGARCGRRARRRPAARACHDLVLGAEAQLDEHLAQQQVVAALALAGEGGAELLVGDGPALDQQLAQLKLRFGSGVIMFVPQSGAWLRRATGRLIPP